MGEKPKNVVAAWEWKKIALGENGILIGSSDSILLFLSPHSWFFANETSTWKHNWGENGKTIRSNLSFVTTKMGMVLLCSWQIFRHMSSARMVLLS